MINSKTMICGILVTLLLAVPLSYSTKTIPFPVAFGQTIGSDSPFERNFQDVEFQDAFFGTFSNGTEQEIEVEPGDEDVPLTVIFANVGSQDITGITGTLSLPTQFSSQFGKGGNIRADFSSNAKEGQIFALTFYVNVDKNAYLGNYPASIKVDYSRLRESGQRTMFFKFDVSITGESTLNMRTLNQVLTSIEQNKVYMEISNSGTTAASNVNIQLQNNLASVAATAESVTNVENVVFDRNEWNIGNVQPDSSKRFPLGIYVPDHLKNSELHIPMQVTYFNAHGKERTVTKTVDLYVNGKIDATVFDVRMINLSGKDSITGQILNEGNDDGLFSFVTVEGVGQSNIKKKSQYVDEIEVDSPVPFNVPIEYEDGKKQFGEHKIKITIRYKDSLRSEHKITHFDTVHVQKPPKKEAGFFDTIFDTQVANNDTTAGQENKGYKLPGEKEPPLPENVTVGVIAPLLNNVVFLGGGVMAIGGFVIYSRISRSKKEKSTKSWR